MGNIGAQCTSIHYRFCSLCIKTSLVFRLSYSFILICEGMSISESTINQINSEQRSAILRKHLHALKVIGFEEERCPKNFLTAFIYFLLLYLNHKFESTKTKIKPA